MSWIGRELEERGAGGEGRKGELEVRVGELEERGAGLESMREET